MKTFTNIAASAAVIAIHFASQCAALEMLAQENTTQNENVLNNTTFNIFEAARELEPVVAAPLWERDQWYQEVNNIVPDDAKIIAAHLDYSIRNVEDHITKAVNDVYINFSHNIAQYPNFERALLALEIRYNSIRTAEMLFHYYVLTENNEQRTHYMSVKMERQMAAEQAESESFAHITNQLIDTYGFQATLPYVQEMYCRYSKEYKEQLHTIFPELANIYAN